MAERQAGEKRVYLAYTCMWLFIIEGSQDRNPNSTGTWRQELMQRPRMSAANLPASPDLLGLFSSKTQNQLPRAPTMGWALSL